MDSLKSASETILSPFRAIGLPCVGDQNFMIIALGSGFLVRSVPRMQTIGAEIALSVPMVGPMVAPYLTPTVHMALAGAMKPLLSNGGQITAEVACGAVLGIIGGMGPNVIPSM